MDSPNRDDFLTNLKKDGKYSGIIGVYRHNISTDHIGIFDAPVVSALAEAGVQWIAHNGAGYDQIDVQACKAAGEAPLRPLPPLLTLTDGSPHRHPRVEHARCGR